MTRDVLDDTQVDHPSSGAVSAGTTGARWLVHRLSELGVTTVYGYPGGAIMPLYDALYDGEIKHVLTRHEQAAALAAIGQARSTGQVGVCIATSGPGATSLITGLADALLDSVAVVAITGQVASSLIDTDAFQDVDVLGLSLACTKHSYLVRELADLPRVVDEAFRIAQSGRPGPVLIDIAKDVLLGHMATSPAVGVPTLSMLPLPDEVDVDAARAMVLTASDPCCTSGVEWSWPMQPLSCVRWPRRAAYRRRRPSRRSGSSTPGPLSTWG